MANPTPDRSLRRLVHELNNVLMDVLSNANYAQELGPHRAEVEEALAAVVAACGRGSVLARELQRRSLEESTAEG
jgi:hypothetical protein